jgi:hypothetical protein
MKVMRKIFNGHGPIYCAETVEEHRSLEESMNTFGQNYAFELDAGANLWGIYIERIVGEGFSRITVSPKEGRIERVVRVGSRSIPISPEESSERGITVKINGASYDIRYTPISRES